MKKGRGQKTSLLAPLADLASHLDDVAYKASSTRDHKKLAYTASVYIIYNFNDDYYNKCSKTIFVRYVQ
jgi:hypothetical protein